MTDGYFNSQDDDILIRPDSGEGFHVPFFSMARRSLPSYDGFIVVELAKDPVPYHVACCFESDWSPEDCHALMMSTCRMACNTTDIVRGRMQFGRIKQLMTASCIKKLETMTYLMDAEMRERPDLKIRLHYLPVIPHMIHGMLVNANTLEMTVYLSIGPDDYWANLVLKRMGSRWMCTLADVG